MSKFKRLLFVIILSSFILVACTNEGVYEENGYGNIIDTIEDNGYEDANEFEENHMAFGPYWLPFIRITEEMRDMMLEDFDYLIEMMLENASTLGVFERRFGLPLEDALADIREKIYNIEPVDSFDSADAHDIAARHLYRLFEWFWMRLEGLGHFGPIVPELYLEMLEISMAGYHQSEIIDGRIIFNGEDVGDAKSQQQFLDMLTLEATLRFYGVDLADLDLYRDPTNIGWHVANNVTTEIIEEDRIAYVHINSFQNSAAFDSEVLFPFFEEVQDFEHLIIDLRGNGGGWAIYFEYYIMAMLIDAPIEARFYEFFTSGAAARQEAEFSLPLSIKLATADEILLARDFINEQTLPYFNESDLDILTYVIPWYIEIEPRENNTPFAGDIWLLVDGGSGSGSELAAMKSIYSGFATVVGTPTARVTPAMTILVPLPNTGILFRIDTGYLIDDLGRSLEEFGVTPDIIIEPRSNALNVVLDLIESQ